MKDLELSKILNIPSTTIRDWKKTNTDNYRRLIYEILINMNEEELEQKVEAIKLLKGAFGRYKV